MLKSELLLFALNDMDDKDLESARIRLGYQTGGTVGHVMKKRIITFALAAALILGLGTVAYALGWFGFSTRLSPAPAPSAELELSPEFGDPSDHHYLSYSGAMGSDTMKASLEWQDYCKAWWESEEADRYTNDDYLAFVATHPEWKFYCDIYQANTEEMVAKLLAISEQYGVRLHNSATTPENDAQFHQLAGIGQFILREEDDYEFQCYIVYEDGSFHGFGFLPFDEEGYPFTFVRSRKNVLDPTVQELYGSEQYEEWQYTTATGALVNIASWDWGHPENGKSLTWVFYENEDTMITVFGTTPLGHESCEAFADSFDFAEAGK